MWESQKARNEKIESKEIAEVDRSCYNAVVQGEEGSRMSWHEVAFQKN